MASTSEEAYHQIRRLIAENGMDSGAKVSEMEIASRLGMSRTPVREALRRLVDDRWLEYLPNRGMKVREWTKKDVLDNFHVRMILECEAVSMSAQCIGDEAIEKMKFLNLQLKSLVKYKTTDSIQKMTELNLEFHQIIWRESTNRVLNEILLKNINIPTMISTYKLYDESKALKSLEEHDELIQCFQDRNSEKAASIMRTHLERAAGEFR
ncbi:MAG: GntR family transcriptional regulator [Cyclobacteriaceae bacterium]|nr:GntR family transcriptional regulator [Cyclobacteriaceae bacterium]MCH8516276.1 GntR family transcriptional regulator [Cyclobacteriaceae bacterium]